MALVGVLLGFTPILTQLEAFKGSLFSEPLQVPECPLQSKLARRPWTLQA